MSDDELELLAPWNETVKVEIERRANESNQSYVNCQNAPATERYTVNHEYWLFSTAVSGGQVYTLVDLDLLRQISGN